MGNSDDEALAEEDNSEDDEEDDDGEVIRNVKGVLARLMGRNCAAEEEHLPPN